MNIDLSHIDLEYGVFFNHQQENHERRIVGVKRYEGKVYSANTLGVYCVERLDSEFVGYIPANGLDKLLLESVAKEQPKYIWPDDPREDMPPMGEISNDELYEKQFTCVITSDDVERGKYE